MASSRVSSNIYNIGSIPPMVNWTIVRGDTCSFQVYVTDDAKAPLTIADWLIKMEIKRPNIKPGDFTDDAVTIVTLIPFPLPTDGLGEFTVTLAKEESTLLETGDIFDIELSQVDKVWTVARGVIIQIEDVTN